MPELKERFTKTLTNEQARQVMRFKVTKLANALCEYCLGEGWVKTPIGLMQCLCKRDIPAEVILYWSIVIREDKIIDEDVPS